MDQHAAVARLTRETVLDFEAIVLEIVVGNQVAVRLAEADE
jgi:hypothetical protein